jgi:hypothetical protein
MQSKVLVIPAGKEFSGMLPGAARLTYTTATFVGANALGLPAILDG